MLHKVTYLKCTSEHTECP